MRRCFLIFLSILAFIPFAISQDAPDYSELIYTLRTDISPDSATKLEQIHEELKGSTPSKKIWSQFIELGITFKRRKDFKKSRECFDWVIHTASKANSWPEVADAHENISILARNRKDYETAKVHMNKALDFSKRTNNNKLISELYYSAGKLHAINEDYYKAIEFYTTSLATGYADESPEQYGRTHLYLSRIFKKQSRFEKAIEHSRYAASYFLKGGEKADLRRSYEVMSHSQIRLGNYADALESASLGLDTVSRTAQQGDEIILLGYLTTIYRKIGYFDNALNHGLEALRIAEETEDPDKIATAALQIAVVHETLGNLDEILIYLNRVLDQDEGAVNPKYTASALKTLSRVYTLKANYSKALEIAKQSMQLYTEMNEMNGLAASLFNMGDIYDKMGNTQSAIEHYESAYIHFKNMSDLYGASNTLMQLGRLHYKQGRTNQGIAVLEKGIREAEGITASTILVNGYKELFNLYRDSEEYEKSSNAAEKYISLQESVLDKQRLSRVSNFHFISKIDQKQEEINQLRSERKINQLELESKAQQIALLNGKRDLQEMQLNESNSTRLLLIFSTLLIAALLLLSIVRYRYLQKIKLALQEKNEVVEQSNNQLLTVNQSKDQFFTMIAHDLKNSIGNLTSCIQFVNTENFTPRDKDATKLLASLKRSANESHQLLLNLLQWAKVQMANIEIDKQPVNLLEAAEATQDVFNNSLLNKEIHLEIDLDDSIVVYTDENILKTVLRNILHNAIKFSHRGGVVVICGYQEDQEFVLCVNDRGIGLPDDFETKIGNTQKFVHGSGTEGEVGSGIGITLCNWLLKLTNSELEFEKMGEGGTTVSFRVPILIKQPSDS